jgi:hypothetical protein
MLRAEDERAVAKQIDEAPTRENFFVEIWMNFRTHRSPSGTYGVVQGSIWVVRN